MKTFKWTVPDDGIGDDPSEAQKKDWGRWKKIEKRGRFFYSAKATVSVVLAFGALHALINYKDSYLEALTSGLIFGSVGSQAYWFYMKRKFNRIHDIDTDQKSDSS